MRPTLAQPGVPHPPLGSSPVPGSQRAEAGAASRETWRRAPCWGVGGGERHRREGSKPPELATENIASEPPAIGPFVSRALNPSKQQREPDGKSTVTLPVPGFGGTEPRWRKTPLCAGLPSAT